MSVFGKLKSYCRLFIQALKGDNQDYTVGSIDRAIVLLSVPMILEMSMEALFAVVDVFFVSQLHDNDAIATVGLTRICAHLDLFSCYGTKYGCNGHGRQTGR
jgi:hypothetical protein